MDQNRKLASNLTKAVPRAPKSSSPIKRLEKGLKKLFVPRRAPALGSSDRPKVAVSNRTPVPNRRVGRNRQVTLQVPPTPIPVPSTPQAPPTRKSPMLTRSARKALALDNQNSNDGERTAPNPTQLF